MSHHSKVVAIAGSAGGIEALMTVLSALPSNFPAAILIAQHLPSRNKHISNLCAVLSRCTRMPVKWSVSGERIGAGTVYVAPQDHHMTVTETGTIHLSGAPTINRSRPSADPLFASLARCYGARAIAVVLSGILWDGAAGVKLVAQAGGSVFAQDQATALYFEMPRAAWNTGCVNSMLPVSSIADALITAVEPHSVLVEDRRPIEKQNAIHSAERAWDQSA